MRFSLCVIFLALCLVVWECTADGEGTDGQLDQRGGSAVTQTTAPKQGSPGILDQSLGQVQQDGEQAGRGEEVDGENEKEIEDDDDDDDGADGDDKAPEGGMQSGTKKGTLGEVDLPQAVVVTTTTTTKKQDTVDVLTPQAGNDHSSLPDGHSTSGVPNTGERRNPQTHNADGSVRTEVDGEKTTTITTAPAPAVQKDVVPPTEVKTTTTTAEGQILSGSQKDKVKEQSTPLKDGDAPDLKITDAAAAATTTTTNGPVKTFPKQSKIPQSVNNKDSSSSTPLLFAFATLITLTMVSVVPVCY